MICLPEAFRLSPSSEDQITWARKGHNLLLLNFTFLCYFFKIENRKASGKQIIALLMINSQHIG